MNPLLQVALLLPSQDRGGTLLLGVDEGIGEGQPALRICVDHLNRGTSFIRNTPLPGPYGRTIPRVLWWS